MTISTNESKYPDSFPITFYIRQLFRDKRFPTEMGFTSSIPFNSPFETLVGLNHGQVGTDPAALNMMINFARAKGAPVRY